MVVLTEGLTVCEEEQRGEGVEGGEEGVITYDLWRKARVQQAMEQLRD